MSGKEVCSVKFSEEISVCNLYTFGKKLIRVSVEVTVASIMGHFLCAYPELNTLCGLSEQILPAPYEMGTAMD